LVSQADKELRQAPVTSDEPDLFGQAPYPVPIPIKSNLPVLAPVRRRPRWRRIVLFILVLLIAGGAGGFYWWRSLQSQLPSGIFSGNGRIEADEIDISTKFAGRIATITADEGYMVKAGQAVATMDTRDLEASLKKSKAQVELSHRAIDEAKANAAQLASQEILAQQEFDRAAALVQKGFQTKEVLDQRRQQLDGAKAALQAGQFREIQAQHALEAATHDVELYTVNIADNTLVAPRDGRIQYRIANVGEVLSAGGKVFAMLDIGYVYMDIYLPTEEAGRVKFGADARIVLDAYPNIAIPAKVTFVATQAQFTPKTVETKTERDKLMFRIRVRIDPERLRARGDAVRSGLPGVAYVRTDPTVAWPERLQGPPT
jgi:HlyD family secretion protein